MLQNDYLVAIVAVDTAENEPLKVSRKIQFIIHSPPYQVHSATAQTTGSTGSTTPVDDAAVLDGVAESRPPAGRQEPAARDSGDGQPGQPILPEDGRGERP